MRRQARDVEEVITIVEYDRLRKRGPPHFNVAIAKDGGESWNTQIIVRDYLFCHADEAEGHSAEKRANYLAGANLFSTCSQSKGPFPEALKDRAIQWHLRTGRKGS